MGRTEQRKGRGGELELTRILQKNGFENVRPGVSESYGCEPDIVGLDNIHIECKRVERLNISKAMAQAVKDSLKFEDGAPTVFHRRNNEKWLVTMRLEDWLKLYGRCEHGRKDIERH